MWTGKEEDPHTSDDRAAWAEVAGGTLIAALADGVTNSYRPDDWADVLVKACISGLIRPAQDRRQLDAAVARLAVELDSGASPTGWLEQALARRGSHSTLVTVTVERVGRTRIWRALAVGDSNLFVVDEAGRLIRSFPVAQVSGFTSRTDTLGSRQAHAGHARRRYRASGPLPPRGALVLASDAIANWLLAAWRRGDRPMRALASAMRSQRSFADTVSRLRDTGAIADDDTTVLVARWR